MTGAEYNGEQAYMKWISYLGRNRVFTEKHRMLKKCILVREICEIILTIKNSSKTWQKEQKILKSYLPEKKIVIVLK